MQQKTYQLDSHRRIVVLGAIEKLCVYRRWTLLATHVRPAHVHLVVAAEESPEKVLNDVKAYASRALNQSEVDRDDRQRWTRHGSTRYLWKAEEVGAAIHYVVRE